jgi:hypothetical protein
MREFRLEREQVLNLPIQRVFDFFADAGNLEAITPPWLHFQIVTPRPIAMKPGALIEYRLRWRIVPIRWLTEIEVWEPPHRFVDQQLKGPYRLWHHTHTFEPSGGGTRMRDTVRYALPLACLGTAAHRIKVRRDLEAIFDYRRDRVTQLLDTR